MSIEEVFSSISIGLIATASPCVLPLYPGFLAYISGGLEAVGRSRRRYLLGFLVLAGVLTMMLTLGLLISLLSISIGQALSVVIPFADLFLVFIGALLLLNINPFRNLPQVKVPVLSNPYVNAFLYGLLYGPIALPCSGTLVVSIFALSLSGGETIGRLSTFLWFGIGLGTPLLLLSFLSGAARRWITRFFARRARIINTIGGILLVALGVYDFVANWGFIKIVLS